LGFNNRTFELKAQPQLAAHENQKQKARDHHVTGFFAGLSSDPASALF